MSNLLRRTIVVTSTVAFALGSVVTGPAMASSPSPADGSATASPSLVPAAPGSPASSPGPTGSPLPDASGAVTGPGLPTTPESFGTGLVPDGWQVVEDATGACRIAVPADWTTDIAPGVGQAGMLAEGLAAVSADSQDWEALTGAIDQFYLTGHVTLVATDDVFLIANPADAGLDLSYVLARRFDDVNCMVLTTVRRNALDAHAEAALLVAQTLDHT